MEKVRFGFIPDRLVFLFNANKGHGLKPLSDTASGGELSRVMLAIKAMITEKNLLPTIIFDEIDTGISGEAARQVGIIMKGLAKKHQVISITHQPQIAAKADAHYFVYKKESLGKIKTHVRQLNEKERVKRKISGLRRNIGKNKKKYSERSDTVLRLHLSPRGSSGKYVLSTA